MEKEKSKNRGFIFVEILLLSAIAIIAASLVLRFVYAKEMKNWEDNLWLSFGVHPLLGRFFVGIIVILEFRVSLSYLADRKFYKQLKKTIKIY